MNRSRFLPGFVLLAGLLASSAAPGQPLPGARGGPAAGASVPMLPKSAGAFITLKVSALADHPQLKAVLAELAKQPDALAGMTEAVGVSPLEMDRVTLFWPRVGGGADPVLVITTREPYNEAHVLKSLQAEPVFDRDFRGRGWGASGGNAAPKAGVKVAEPPAAKAFPPPGGSGAAPPPPPGEKKQDDPCAPADAGSSDPLFYTLNRGQFQALFLIDDHTLVFLPGGPDGDFTMLALLAVALKKNATGPLADAITAAGKHTLAAGVYLTPLFREFERSVPQDLVPYTALFATRTAVLIGDLDKTVQLTLTLNYDDATAAKRAAPVLEEGFAAIAEKAGKWVDELKQSPRPFEKSSAPLVAAFAAGLKKGTVKADGTAVIAATEIEGGPAVAKALGEMLQATQSRKKAVARMNNLKQIGLALHSYHDANNKFPTNVYGPKGEVLLSWRVHLLPYLEQENLYRQFKMDEPWDGPNNKKLIDKMPKVFMAPDREAEKGKTFYQAFIGPAPGKPLPKGIFGRPWLQEGDKNGIRITEIFDGTSNTIAVIEARDGVIWSKPDDLPYGGPVPPLGEKGWDRTPALRFDGSVFLLPTNLKPEVFWPLISINGGELTPDPDDERRPFGGWRASPPVGVGSEPLPGNPVPAKGGAGEGQRGELREQEQRVAELTEVLRAEQARAEVAEATLQRTLQAFQVGAVNAAEVEKAKAIVADARARVASRTAQLEQARAKLDALRSVPKK